MSFYPTPPAPVSCYLMAGLRNRLAGGPSVERADALIEPQGAIAHARGTAAPKAARRALTESVLALERIRAQTRRRAGRALMNGTSDDESLRELVALFFRYDMDRKQLTTFKSERNEGWLTRQCLLWFDKMFGSR